MIKGVGVFLTLGMLIPLAFGWRPKAYNKTLEWRFSNG